MPTTPLNFKHLHYFWVVAQEGSMTRAADRLGVAVQTISVQLAQLEQSLGKALLVSQGRSLALTEAGRTALGYADQIFSLGEALVDALQAGDTQRQLRLLAGISDGLPKLVAHRLLSALFCDDQSLRLVCHEGEFADLLAELAIHKLDVLLTDRPAPTSGNLRVFSHPLGELAMGWFARPQLIERHRDRFPACLAELPVLLPTRHNMLRGQIDRWFESIGVRPDIAGEFEDSALLQTFAGAGLGVFPAPLALSADVASQLDAALLGEMPGVVEQIYAISSQRRVAHPAVEKLCQSRLAPL